MRKTAENFELCALKLKAAVFLWYNSSIGDA